MSDDAKASLGPWARNDRGDWTRRDERNRLGAAVWAPGSDGRAVWRWWAMGWTFKSTHGEATSEDEAKRLADEAHRALS